MRYGNVKAIAGPCVEASTSKIFDSDASLWGTSGGGSITCDGDLSAADSGNSVMISPDEVSIVICLVLGAFRGV